MVRDGPGNLNNRVNFWTLNGNDANRDLAVVDENTITGAAITRQALERSRDEFLCAGDILGGDGEFVTHVQLHRAVGKRTQADLGSLKIHKYRDRTPDDLCCLTNSKNALLMLRMGAVGSIDSSYVHARSGQL